MLRISSYMFWHRNTILWESTQTNPTCQSRY